jgi:hypothetical protein
MAILVSILLAGPRAFAEDDSLKPFLGIWEYGMRDPASPTGYDKEEERLELNEKGGAIQGLYFGLERGEDHGLFYTLVEIKNVEVSKGGKITFIVPDRDFYPVRPRSLAEAEDLKKHNLTSGGIRSEMKFQGQLKNGHLILQCTADRYQCPEDVMVFRRGQGDTEKEQALPSPAAELITKFKKCDIAVVKAAGKGQTDIVKTFLEQGTDVNAKDCKGHTALIKAAWGGHTETVKALLAKGADVNIVGGYGLSALMFAAGYGYTDIVQALLEQGADVNAKNNDGQTALMIANEAGRVEIIQMLKKSGAK